jgi:molecular chaperone GrpE
VSKCLNKSFGKLFAQRVFKFFKLKDMQEDTKSAEEQPLQEETIQDNTQAAENGQEQATAAENIQNTDLEKLQQEVNEQRDKYLRLFAEFDNFKKRSAKEKRDFALVAGQDIVKDLLPIIDDIKRANQSFTKDNSKENYADGLHLICEKFVKTLQNKGLKEMESIGADFDFEKHEAIAEIPAPNEEQKGKVVDEVEAGYTLNNVIIRYAKVIVGK